MTNYNEIFGYKTFSGFMTAARLKRITECVKEYKGYSIAFGKYQRDAEGRAWWSVRVWKNDGKECTGVFTMKSLCATDAEAMHMATKWAKANIDRIAE